MILINTFNIYVVTTNGNLRQADVLQVALDNLFSDFMSAACNPAANPEIDTAQENKFTDQVDNEVFLVKRKLAEALYIKEPTQC